MKLKSLTANGVLVASITLSWPPEGVCVSEGGGGRWMGARSRLRPPVCRVRPRTQDLDHWMWYSGTFL
jgi:hypothetical protein